MTDIVGTEWPRKGELVIWAYDQYKTTIQWVDPTIHQTKQITRQYVYDHLPCLLPFTKSMEFIHTTNIKNLLDQPVHLRDS